MPRNYKPNGRPNGGKRPGAGRPEGSKNVLEKGAVAALRAAGLRVPDGAPEAHRELADECLGTIVDVMRGDVPFTQAPMRLKAATHLREEICGPLKQKIEHSFDGLTDEQLEAKAKAAAERLQFSSGAGSTANAASQSKGDDGASLGLNGDDTESGDA